MKSNLEMMNEIKNETYRQIENSLQNGEFLITSLTIYDKNNSLAVNLFLTNVAIFMQESNDIERIKKRLFDKIVDIKLTSNEFYIEFQNGYKLIGDTTVCQDEANRFFECIRSNTTIKTSSTKELENINYDIPETKEIPRFNPFGSFKKEEPVQPEEPTFVKTLEPTLTTNDESPKKSKLGLFISIGIGIVALISTIIVVILLIGNSKPKVDEKTLAIQIRAEELLSYQVDINKAYDYLFELTGYYEEYEAGFTSQSKLDIETAFEKLKIDYEKNLNKKYKSNSQVYKIYEVSVIDGWMNEDIKLLNEIFELYETVIDEDYRDDSNIISLQSKLTTADTKIRKTQDCLQEEKDSLNKELGKSSSSDSTNTKSKETATETKKATETKSNKTDSTQEKETSKTENTKTETEEDDFSYENEKEDDDGDDEEPEGKQEEASFISE